MMDDHRTGQPPDEDESSSANGSDDDIVELTSVQGEIEASVIRSLLESNGIVPLAKSELVQSIWPLSVDGLGKVTIWVRRADRERALAVIAEFKE